MRKLESRSAQDQRQAAPNLPESFEPSIAAQLTVSFWVIAVLLAIIEIGWLLSNRVVTL